MSELYHNRGFHSGGFFNLTPREAYAKATKGCAVIVDVREERLTA